MMNIGVYISSVTSIGPVAKQNERLRLSDIDTGRTQAALHVNEVSSREI